MEHEIDLKEELGIEDPGHLSEDIADSAGPFWGTLRDFAAQDACHALRH